MVRAPSLPNVRLGRQRRGAGLVDGHHHGVAELVPHAAAPALAGGGIDAARLIDERPEGAPRGDDQAETRNLAVAGDGRLERTAQKLRSARSR